MIMHARKVRRTRCIVLDSFRSGYEIVYEIDLFG
jgi:hypothetical protein